MELGHPPCPGESRVWLFLGVGLGSLMCCGAPNSLDRPLPALVTHRWPQLNIVHLRRSTHLHFLKDTGEKIIHEIRPWVTGLDKTQSNRNSGASGVSLSRKVLIWQLDAAKCSKLSQISCLCLARKAPRAFPPSPLLFFVAQQVFYSYKGPGNPSIIMESQTKN